MRPNQPQVELISTSSPDLIADIAYMARVSNPANQSNELTSRKLVEYLIKHKHWSPFEMCGITYRNQYYSRHCSPDSASS